MRKVVASKLKRIKIKAPWEIELLKKANVIVAEVLNTLREEITPGISADTLDRMAEEICKNKGGIPAFKGYRGYPFSLCVSVNEEVVHGFPKKDKILKEGDIVSLDFGAIYEGYYGDAAITVPVGKIDEKAQKLLKVTKEALYLAIEQARIGNRLQDISATIQRHVEKAGYNVIRDYVGHGIGQSLHEPPEIPNYGKKGKGPRLKAGMVLAIEPMVAMGGYELEVLPDGWTAVTKDRSLAAHFEHSVVITVEGPKILSLLEE